MTTLFVHCLICKVFQEHNKVEARNKTKIEIIVPH